jgi:hypothetical protein
MRSLGLERYEAAFRDNEIDGTVLPNLAAEDLKDLGVGIIGHRRKILDAIATLRIGEGAKAPPVVSKTGTIPENLAERRQVTGDVLGLGRFDGALSPHGPGGLVRLFRLIADSGNS